MVFTAHPPLLLGVTALAADPRRPPPRLHRRRRSGPALSPSPTPSPTPEASATPSPDYDPTEAIFGIFSGIDHEFETTLGALEEVRIHPDHSQVPVIVEIMRLYRSVVAR